MRSEILGKVAADLLSVPPLIFRLLRRKLIKTTLAGINVDIKFPHLQIMKVLQEEGTLHVCAIGEKLQIARAQMTPLIDKLVDLNLVQRQMNSTDRRTLNIALTDKGKELLEEHENFLMSTVREQMSSLTDKELETLASSLESLRDILFKLQ